MAKHERGNIMFFILIAIVLIGLVTVALRNSGLESTGIDREGNIINVAQLRQYTTELERAIAYVLQNQISETEISFAHPDAPSAYGTYGTNPRAEIFHPQGGGANWRNPPSGVNDGSGWEFYATSMVPGVGSDRADLIAVLPFMTQAACDEINRINDQTGSPEDGGTCFYSGASNRFAGSYSDSTPNEMDSNIDDGLNFTAIPATQACVRCGTDYHFYHVLMAR
jgi:hypothetical protein